MIISSSTHLTNFSSTLQPSAAASAREEIAAARAQPIAPIEEPKKSEAPTDRRDQVKPNEAQQSASNSDVAQQLDDRGVITELKTRDREVRAHEAAHAAVGGQHAGAPTYAFKNGPNGVSYAVSGEVSISTSTISGNPQATLQKAQQIQRAALAPAEPSTQDRHVAAQATQMAQQARVDIAQQPELEPGSLQSRTSDDDLPTSVVNIPQLLSDAGVREGNQAGRIIDHIA